jgi:hypothetical protein
MKLTCRSCGWHHVYPQRSDVLVLPGACAACASVDLERSVAGALDAPLALLELVLHRFRRRARMKP